jgi:hypothetical protein
MENKEMHSKLNVIIAYYMYLPRTRSVNVRNGRPTHFVGIQ